MTRSIDRLLPGVCVFALLCSSIPATAAADGPNEQQRMAAIAVEIERVRRLVREGHSDGRMKFDYEALEQMLADAEFVVRNHLSLLNSVPRTHWDLTRRDLLDRASRAREP